METYFGNSDQLRHSYATFQILYGKIDLHTLSKSMGTSIAMLEQHYSHLEVTRKAELLAGRAETTMRKQRQETKIVVLENKELGEVLESECLGQSPMELRVRDGK